MSKKKKKGLQKFKHSLKKNNQATVPQYEKDVCTKGCIVLNLFSVKLT